MRSKGIQMTIHYNRESEKVNRRKLRRNSTKAEEILWDYLKNRKLLGLKFKRQYSIDQFVIDFYCSEIKLGIELDGKIHLKREVKIHDENREGYLNDFGIKFLRINNDEVIIDIEEVITEINKKVLEIKKTSPKSSPYKGEDLRA
ncbi:MAG TPA: endonuclease domain-containing protein [Ignavibacteriaceae bacterium]